MEKFTIEKIQQDAQDIRMNMQRYLVTLQEPSTTFTCRRFLAGRRPHHIYFSEDTQWNVDGDLLDMIEDEIVTKYSN